MKIETRNQPKDPLLLDLYLEDLVLGLAVVAEVLGEADFTAQNPHFPPLAGSAGWPLGPGFADRGRVR